MPAKFQKGLLKHVGGVAHTHTIGDLLSLFLEKAGDMDGHIDASRIL